MSGKRNVGADANICVALLRGVNAGKAKAHRNGCAGGVLESGLALTAKKSSGQSVATRNWATGVKRKSMTAAES